MIMNYRAWGCIGFKIFFTSCWWKSYWDNFQSGLSLIILGSILWVYLCILYVTESIDGVVYWEVCTWYLSYHYCAWSALPSPCMWWLNATASAHRRGSTQKCTTVTRARKYQSHEVYLSVTLKPWHSVLTGFEVYWLLSSRLRLELGSRPAHTSDWCKW